MATNSKAWRLVEQERDAVLLKQKSRSAVCAQLRAERPEATARVAAKLAGMTERKLQRKADALASARTQRGRRGDSI